MAAPRYPMGRLPDLYGSNGNFVAHGKPHRGRFIMGFVNGAQPLQSLNQGGS